MQRIILTFIVFLSFVFVSVSQRSVTTISGQKINLMPDGKWDYEPMVIEGDSIDVMVTGFLTEADTVRADSVVENKIKSGITSLEHAAKLQEVEAFLTLDQLEREIASQKVTLSQARDMKNETDIKSVKAVIKDLEVKAKTARHIYKYKAGLIDKCRKLDKLKPEQLTSQMVSLGNELGVDVSPYMGLPSAIPGEEPVILKTKVNGKCLIVKDETNDKQRYLESAETLFFTFTPANIKTYFKDKDLITATVFFTRMGKNLFLNLKLRMISNDASKNYGFIPVESMLRIDFISGRNVILNAYEESYSIVEKYSGNVIYQVKYPVNGEEADLMQKVPVDALGIMWSSGFERYDIYEVDALINHLGCFK